MGVAKFVPPIALHEGCVVRVLEQLAPDHGLEHHEVRGDWLVPSRDQPVDDPWASLGRDYEIRPAVKIERLILA